MGIREAWGALWHRGAREKAADALAETLDIMGAPTARDEAHGILAGAIPYSQPPKRGTLELMVVYATAPWLRAVVGRLAQRVATTEWQIEKVVSGATGGKAIVPKAAQHAGGRALRDKALERYAKAGLEVQPIEDHPVLDFLRTGNSVLDGRGCMHVSAVHVLLKGECYWLLERHESGPMVGLPKAYWPIPPFWVAEMPTVNRPFYRLAFMSWNVMVPESEVLRFTDPDPFNPFGRGIGIAQSLTDEIDGDEYAKKWIKGRLYNHGIPRNLVTMEGGDKKEAERLKEEWAESFRGIQNSFRTWFTPRKLTLLQVEPKFEEMKLLELRASARDSMLEAYGYPKELLGILTNANRSTIDTAEFRLEKYAVEPWREFFRHGLQHRLMPAYTDKAVLGYENDVPADREFLLAAAKARPSAFSNNEVREFAGIDATEEDWGDERPSTDRLLPLLGGAVGPGADAQPTDAATPTGDVAQPSTSLNGMQVQSLVQILQSVASGQLPRASGIALIVSAFALSQDAAEEIMSDIGKGFTPEPPAPPAAPPETDPEVKSLVKSPRWLRRKGPNDDDGRPFTHDDIDDIADAIGSDSVALGGDDLQSILEKNIRSIGGKTLQSLGIKPSAFDYRSPEVKRYLEEDSSESISGINDTTADDIRAALGKVADDGGSVADAAREIRRVFDEASTSRSEAIAQTEMLRASGVATQEGFNQSGLSLEKYWQHGGGEDDPRQGHVELAAMDPIPLNQPFVNPETGVSMQYPGEAGDPGEDCNCHCSHWARASDPEKAAKALAPTGAQQRAWRKKGHAAVKRVVKAAFARQRTAALKALR